MWREFQVVPANVWDSFFGADILDVSMTQILGTAVSTPATAGILDVNVKNIDNDAASASGTVTFPNATLASTTNITAGTITTATNVTTVNGLAAGVITATSIAADAITDAKVAADVTIASVTGAVGSVTGAVGSVTGAVGSVTAAVTVGTISANVITASALAADAVAEIADGVWDEDATGHQTQGSFGQAIGDPGADADSIWALANTNLDATVSSRLSTAGYTAPDNASITAILADTGTDGVVVAAASKTGYTLSAAGVQAVWDALTTALTTAGSIGKKLADWVIGTSQTGDAFARLGAPAGASVSADIAAVKSDTAAIKTKTDSLAFTVAGQVDANIQSVNDVTVVGDGSGTPWGP